MHHLICRGAGRWLLLWLKTGSEKTLSVSIGVDAAIGRLKVDVGAVVELMRLGHPLRMKRQDELREEAPING